MKLRRIIALVVIATLITIFATTVFAGTGASFSYPSGNGEANQVFVSSANADQGLIEPSSVDGNLEEGDTWKFTARPAAGYEFDSWDVSGADNVSGLDANSSVLSFSYKEGAMAADEGNRFSAVASFKPVAAENPEATTSAETSVSPEASAEPSTSAQPSVEPSAEPSTSAQPSAEPSAEPSTSAQPSAEPTVSPEVTVSPEPSVNPEPSLEPDSVMGMNALAAPAAQNYTLNIQKLGPSSITNSSTVTPASGTQFPAGTVVDLSATPKSGSKLIGFFKNAVSTQYGTVYQGLISQITMDSDKTVYAIFGSTGYTFDHIDVELDGSIKIDRQINGISQPGYPKTLNVTVSNPSATIVAGSTINLPKDRFNISGVEFRALNLSYSWPSSVTVNATLTDQDKHTYAFNHKFTDGEMKEAYAFCPGTEDNRSKGFDYVLSASDIVNEITNTVTFKPSTGGTLNGGNPNVVHTGVLNNTDCPTPPGVTESTGYSFTGWTKDNGSTLYTTAQVDAMTITADTTFTAQFATRDYTVTYVAGSGGSLTGSATETVKYNETPANVPGINENADEVFAGWYKNSETTLLSSADVDNTVITADTTFTAQYQIAFRVKNMNGNGGDHGFVKVTYNGTSVNLEAGQEHKFGYVPDAGNAQVSFVADSGWAFHYYVIDNGAQHINNNPDNINPSSYAGQNGDNNMIKVNPKWTTGFYKVTYDGNGATGGSVPNDSKSYGNDDIVTVLSNTGALAKTGCTLAGWTINQDGSGTVYIAGSTFTMSTANVTLYAKWTPINYIITYDLKDGTVSTANPTSYNVDTPTFTLNNPTKKGYTFTGWTGTGYSTPTLSVTIDKGSTGNKEFTANWTATIYHITYEMNNGTNHPGNPTTYTIETPTINLKDPTKNGYTFGSWDPEGTIPQGSTGDKKFTANWLKADEYSIEYVLGDGGTNHPDNPSKYTIETPTITLKDPTRDGYTFSGWTPTSTIPQGSTGNKTFIAKWTAISYKIDYNLDGGSVSPENPISYTIETETFKLNNPTRNGYTFTGWTGTELSSATDPVTIVKGSTGDRSYKATWTENSYNITYDLQYGSVDIATPNPDSYKITSLDITLNNPTKNGYVFVGWTGTGLSTATTTVKIPTGSTGDRHYVASWKAEDYTIKYDLKGGSVSTANPDHYSITTPNITLNNPTRNGYKFEGWEGTGLSSATNPVIIPEGSTGNRSYVATWSAIEYTITYNMNDGVNHSDNPATYTVEKLPITLKDPTKNGYTFNNWTDSNNNSVVNIPAGTTGNLTFTANWLAANEYGITYILNGGSNHADNPSKYTVETPTITLKDPTYTGYKFTGWNPEGIIPKGSTGTKTFTAGWQIEEYPITYDLKGGAVDPANPTSYTVETNTFTLNNPIKNGYTFTGWTGTELSAATETVTILKGSTGSRNYVATWKATEFNINYVMNGGTNNDGNPTKYTIESADITLLDPTRNGYTFDGWTPEGKIPSGSTGDRTFTASWKIVDYDITYVLNGGSNNPDNPAKYTVESDTITLKDPTRTGYSFNGWTPVGIIPKGSTGNKTFEASWTAIEYDITYVMNGGTNNDSNPATYTVEQLPIVLQNPTYTGHKFNGWTPVNSIPVGTTGNLTFTANWDINTYPISTSATNGTITPGRSASYGETVKIEYQANTGYHLDSITVDGTKLADISGYGNSYTFTGVDQAHSISVVFVANPYTISTTVTNGTISTSQSAVAGGNVNVTYNANTGYHLESITVDGTALTNLGPSQTSYSFQNILADHTIAVVYAPNIYTVTTNVTNGTITPSSTTFYGKDVTVTFSPTSGYRLTGITIDGTPIVGFSPNLAIYTFKDIASSHNIAVTYAQNMFLVTFVDYNSNVLGTDAVEYNTAATAPANPTRGGYTFTGWDRDFSHVVSDMTVTATYSGPLTYRVRFFQADGTTQIGTSQTVTWGAVARTETAPAVANSTFSGWRLTGDNPNVATRLSNVRENIDAVATYNAVPIPVTFIDYNNDELGTDSVPYGGDATAPNDPTREGYTFTGWSPSYDNVTTELTVVAQYRINTFTVTFVDHDGDVIDRQTVDWNTGADAPEEPTRDGYEFTGWDVPFNRITKDTTVTAQYGGGPAPSPTTINEEPIPQTGGTPCDCSWLWWLLLIPGLGLLWLLLAAWLTIVPIAEAVADNGNGTYTVQWGYENRKLKKCKVDRDKSFITVFAGTLLGSSNNPPVEFEKGRVENVFTTIVDKDTEIQWKIKRRKAKVDIKKLEKHN